jgi:carbon storage regulator
MLVLTRRPGERIRIGHDIEIVVASVRDGQVRIGVAAPRHVEVHREEIYRDLVAANMAAHRSRAARPGEAQR